MMRAGWLVVCCVLVAPLATGQVQRPNLIIVVADQLRRESCGYAGDAKAITPHIDGLARDGMSFDITSSIRPFVRPHGPRCGRVSMPGSHGW